MQVKTQAVSSLASQDVESWRSKEFSSGPGEGSALWTENLKQWVSKDKTNEVRVCYTTALHSTSKRTRFTFLIDVMGLLA